MTRLDTTQRGTLEDPVPITSLPYAQTIDVSERSAEAGRAVSLPAHGHLRLVRPGTTRCRQARRRPRRLDAARPGRPPLPAGRERPCGQRLPRLREPDLERAALARVPVARGETLLAQVGTSESLDGRLVVRAELRTVTGDR